MHLYAQNICKVQIRSRSPEIMLDFESGLLEVRDGICMDTWQHALHPPILNLPMSMNPQNR